MEITVVKDRIVKDELRLIAREQFGNLVKAVVDVEKEIMAIGGYHHEDERELLIRQEGSKFDDLWGINLYPERVGKDFIEFDSSINLKLSSGSKGIYHPEIQKKIRNIVGKLVSERI
ncbi:MAG: DUF5674 family protein [Candidatus Nealsonbacteria bacterium]